MKITLTADNDEKTIDFELTNDDIDNSNFIAIIAEKKEYYVSVTDLFEAVLTFQRIKDREKETEEKWKF